MTDTHIAIITLDGFNELDSFIAFSILNRVNDPNWHVNITCPKPSVTSMNGVTVEAQQSIAYANKADIVLFGSGMKTLMHSKDRGLMDSFDLDPARQLIGAQCSGVWLLHCLGLLNAKAASDATTTPMLSEQGIDVCDTAFYAAGNIATAGGCLSSHYLGAWAIAKRLGWGAANEVIDYVAPVGEKQQYCDRTFATLSPYLD